MNEQTQPAGSSPVEAPVRRHYVNDWGVTVYAYQTELGGVYHREETARGWVFERPARHELCKNWRSGRGSNTRPRRDRPGDEVSIHAGLLLFWFSKNGDG